MGKTRRTAEKIVSKLRQMDVLTAQGRTVAGAIRQIGVTEVTYYPGDPSTAGSRLTRSRRTPGCAEPSRISPWRS